MAISTQALSIVLGVSAPSEQRNDVIEFYRCRYITTLLARDAQGVLAEVRVPYRLKPAASDAFGSHKMQKARCLCGLGNFRADFQR